MKKLKLNIEDIFNINSAVIYNPDNFKPLSKVSIDSRTISRNSLFVAIKGSKFDGHEFVDTAIINGASAVLINKKKLKEFDRVNIPLITVNDTTEALGELANVWRKKLSAKVISITGSNGKTTTKEILAAIFSEKHKVVKTFANNNNHIGVPLAIFNADEKTEYLILEHGTNHFGEIKYTAAIAEPDYSLITNIGSSHLEYLKNFDGVLKEKYSLFEETVKNSGLVFVNSDDLRLKKITKMNKSKVTFGFKGKPDYKAKILNFGHDGCSEIEISASNKTMKFKIPLLGKANAQNVLAAVAIAHKLGVSKSAISEGLKKIAPPKGRLNSLRLNSNLLIDDTYNSNPESLKNALDIIGKIKGYKNKILVLGDMYELGNDSARLHKSLKSSFKLKSSDSVFAIGSKMKLLVVELVKQKINAQHFRTRKVLRDFLTIQQFSDSVILVKGSRGMKMEEFVEILMNKAK
ncbi:MAG: UDP-N-acetylmuramoyl-tripeptide--D-alanyl-D-alanine ligase [Bacteroidetes bacterium]|nr:UDP-N-acetylmuramoyl-tripeptide--D-alanyl-D-alanine ligase [Bacteroidota bacterium]MBU1678628.1 UDP-N-acetylmuramoyl-tripeptide--D-alanyl-D-alanine ligase [Bacteroidota bacterium]